MVATIVLIPKRLVECQGQGFNWLPARDQVHAAPA